MAGLTAHGGTGNGPVGAAALTALHELTPAHLTVLAGALEGGTLAPPYPVPALQRVVPQARVSALRASLTQLASIGVPPVHIALLVRAISTERERAQRIADRVSLVWTGPEVPAAETRDTSVVVRELFEQARQRVLVTGFVVYDGKSVFAPLAAKMQAIPELDVRIFLNVARPDGDERDAAHVVNDFAVQFAKYHWPSARPPALFHDPRALEAKPFERAVLHAKCVVVDDEVAFVTSANLTGAAQYRNVEVGVLVEDPLFARRLRTHFDVLADHGILQPIPWPHQ